MFLAEVEFISNLKMNNIIAKLKLAVRKRLRSFLNDLLDTDAHNIEKELQRMPKGKQQDIS